MKYPKLLSLALLSLIFMISCKKDKKTPDETPTNPVVQPVSAPKKIDTLKPSSPYLPVFPGSWWKYQSVKNGSIIPTSDTITKKTGPTYIKDVYNYTDIYNGHKTFTSDTFYVPVYEGITVWGDKKEAWFSYGGYQLIPLVSDVLGHTWATHDQSHVANEAKVEKKDTSLTINGVSYYPVISILYYSYGTSPQTPYFYSSRQFYAKNVGLIAAQSFYDYKKDSISSEIHLVDHYINNH
jgi:hypothetical protein